MSKIAYTDKVDLSTSSVADINKVKAADMNEIKSVVNTNDDNIGDLTNLTTTEKGSVVGAINELVVNMGVGKTYSTTEFDTGEKWTDGKTIYCKVLEGGSVSGGGTTNVSTGVNNIDKMLDSYGFAYDSSGNWFPLSRAHPNGIYALTYYYNKGNNQFSVEAGSSAPLSSFIVIMRYTKTS